MNRGSPQKARHGRIALIGMMGTGKSTVGKYLANELGWQFHDCDILLCASTGKTIGQLFDVEGEDSFRTRESELLKDLMSVDAQTVIATGGGAVISKTNRQILVRDSYCVFLNAPLPVLADRISAHSKSAARPLLKDTDVTRRLSQLWHERAPLYEEIAHHTVNTANGSPRQIARALALWYRQRLS